MPVASNPDRDEEIAHLLGDPDADVDEIALQYGISRSRVRQIGVAFDVKRRDDVWFCPWCQDWVSLAGHPHTREVRRNRVRIPPEMEARLRVLRAEGFSWRELAQVAVRDFGRPYKNLNSAQAALHNLLNR